MIVDLILDRYDSLEAGDPDRYSPADFYRNVLNYQPTAGKFADVITYAMDYFGENLVRRALCEYVYGNNYNPGICNFINSVTWLEPVSEYSHVSIAWSPDR